MSGYRHGDPKAFCQSCGHTMHLSDLKKDYRGVLTCDRCWDPRHPQELVRPIKEPKLPYTSPEPADVFNNAVCNSTTKRAAAGEGTADCMIVGYPYAFPDLFPPDPTFGPCSTAEVTAIAGYAVSGCSITGNT